MQATTLQISVLMAIAFVLLILFVVTNIQMSSSTTVSVGRPNPSVARGHKLTQISQQSDKYTGHQDALQSNLDVRDDGAELANEVRRVSVRVYVEALCPDSARFVVYDLAGDHFPSSLWDIVDIKYIFWGNANVLEDGIVFCQHGPNECELNTLLQCALSVAAFAPSPVHVPPGQPPLAQTLLECFFAKELKLHGRYPEVKTAAEACIVAAGLPSERIQQCAAQGLDSDASQYARAATESLSPPHTWVPWVTVDGNPINSKQLGEAAHVGRAVCDAYTGPTRPAGCAQFSPASNL